jgi:hypothetical protein
LESKLCSADREPEAEEAVEEDKATVARETGSELSSFVESGRGGVKGSDSRLEKEMVISFPCQATGDAVPVLPVVPVESESQAQINQGDAELALVQAVGTWVVLSISLGTMLFTDRWSLRRAGTGFNNTWLPGWP